MIRFISGILVLSVAVLIPALYFEQLLVFFVSAIGTGWVAGSIAVRLLVIFLVLLSLFSFRAAIIKLKKIKSWVLVALAFPIGFGISFISPIYAVDYGDLSDGMKLENLESLTANTGIQIPGKSKHTLITFFTTGCPHCKAASEKLGTNIDAGQKVEVVSLFPGEKEDAESFLEKHRGEKFTIGMIDNDSQFLSISGGSFPSIFLLDEKGNTLHHWVGDQFNYTALDLVRSLD